jgi:hypothetical protein
VTCGDVRTTRGVGLECSWRDYAQHSIEGMWKAGDSAYLCFWASSVSPAANGPEPSPTSWTKVDLLGVTPDSLTSPVGPRHPQEWIWLPPGSILFVIEGVLGVAVLGGRSFVGEAMEPCSGDSSTLRSNRAKYSTLFPFILFTLIKSESEVGKGPQHLRIASSTSS